MIRCHQHIRSVDVGYLLDDLIQFVEGLLHGIERFGLRAGGVPNLVDPVVKDVDSIMIAHKGAAISLAIQLQEVFSLDGGRPCTTSHTQNQAPVFGP